MPGRTEGEHLSEAAENEALALAHGSSGGRPAAATTGTSSWGAGYTPPEVLQAASVRHVATPNTSPPYLAGPVTVCADCAQPLIHQTAVPGVRDARWIHIDGRLDPEDAPHHFPTRPPTVAQLREEHRAELEALQAMEHRATPAVGTIHEPIGGVREAQPAHATCNDCGRGIRWSIEAGDWLHDNLVIPMTPSGAGSPPDTPPRTAVATDEQEPGPPRTPGVGAIRYDGGARRSMWTGAEWVPIAPHSTPAEDEYDVFVQPYPPRQRPWVKWLDTNHDQWVTWNGYHWVPTTPPTGETTPATPPTPAEWAHAADLIDPPPENFVMDPADYRAASQAAVALEDAGEAVDRALGIIGRAPISGSDGISDVYERLGSMVTEILVERSRILNRLHNHNQAVEEARVAYAEKDEQLDGDASDHVPVELPPGETHTFVIEQDPDARSDEGVRYGITEVTRHPSAVTVWQEGNNGRWHFITGFDLSWSAKSERMVLRIPRAAYAFPTARPVFQAVVTY